MWTHDGTSHRLSFDSYSVLVLESDPEPFTVPVDVEVEVHGDGKRWTATFITPEQMRECLTSWAESGEWQAGTYLWIPDGVVVSELTLTNIGAVVEGAFNADSSMEPPFSLFDEIS